MGFDVILRHKHTIMHVDYNVWSLSVCLFGGASVSRLAQAKLSLISLGSGYSFRGGQTWRCLGTAPYLTYSDQFICRNSNLHSLIEITHQFGITSECKIAFTCRLNATGVTQCGWSCQTSASINVLTPSFTQTHALAHSRTCRGQQRRTSRSAQREPQDVF